MEYLPWFFFFTFSLVPPSVLCGKPHETVVALDPSNHAYYPFYVKLHRCMGSKGALSPKVRRCVPSGFEELNIPVYEPAKNYKRTNLLVKNHTSCTDECVASPEMCNLVLEKWDEESCTCQCMYPDEPPKEHACKERFRYVEITAGASKVPFPQVWLLIAWTDLGAIVKVEIYAMNESPRQLTFLSPTHTPRCFVLAIWGHPKNRLHAAPLRWANGPQHTYVKFPGGSWKANVPYNDQNVALTRSETLGKKTFKNFKSETASIPCEHRLFDLPI